MYIKLVLNLPSIYYIEQEEILELKILFLLPK